MAVEITFMFLVGSFGDKFGSHLITLLSWSLIDKRVSTALAHLVRVLFAIVAAGNELYSWAYLLVASPCPKAKVCVRSATSLNSSNAGKSDLLLNFDHVVELASGLVLAIDAECRLYRLRTHFHNVMRYACGQSAVVHEILTVV